MKTLLKRAFFIILAFMTLTLQAGCNDILSSSSDRKFGGYFLDIEKAMRKLQVSRLTAHEIQNQMRDILEKRANSFSRVEQKSYVASALREAIKLVKENSVSEGGFKPISFSEGDFVVALDLDETLLSQWYSKGNRGVGTFNVPPKFADVVPRWTDKEGNSTGNPEMLASGNMIQIRPGVDKFMKIVAKLSGFKGFVLFTAKEDKAAWAVKREWRKINPTLFKNVVGFYTRNYLKLQGKLQKPSKDLRIFDPR